MRIIAEGSPDREQFPHLNFPPFTFNVGRTVSHATCGDLRVDGLIDGKVVISKRYSGSGEDKKFVLLPDEAELLANGADAVRVVLRVTDEFGSSRHYASDAIELKIDGPGVIVGDAPFGLIGGTGAVWIRTTETPGKIFLTGRHPHMGTATVEFQSATTTAEVVLEKLSFKVTSLPQSCSGRVADGCDGPAATESVAGADSVCGKKFGDRHDAALAPATLSRMCCR